MRLSPVWRRSSSATAGIYVSAGIGFLGSVVAFRELGTVAFGRLALVLAAAGFFQLFADLTVEEAVVKFGFRYAAREDWGRFHRVFGVGLRLKLAGGLLAGGAILVLAPLSHLIWNAHGIAWPLVVAALLPVAQAPEGLAAAVLIVRRRYDVRAGLLCLSMLLRLGALAAGAAYGVLETVVALVVAQALATVTIGAVALVALRRFPDARAEPLADDRRPFRAFVIQSSLGSVLSPMRGLLATMLLGIVTTVRQVGYFRIGQVPESGFASLSSPIRMVLLSEQTHDFEHGRRDRVYRLLNRYVAGAGALMVVLLPPLLWLMPTLIRIAYGERALPATNAARLILFVAAIQVVLGWSKSFPVSIGRPALRLVAQGVELVVLVPALLVLGSRYGATGAAGGFLVAACALAVTWVVILLRLRHDPDLRALPDAAGISARR
jgi:O-antigen/teichoic acid export membrane protein